MGAVTAGIGAVTGAAKFFEGRKMQREGQRAIENFEWQELTNPYKDLSVSTLGADLRREEAARGTATAVDALKSGGTRGIVGGLGRVQAQSNLLNRDIATGLDQQQKQIDYAIAQDEARIRAMEEQRQQQELAGYGQQMNTGFQTKYGGMGDILNTAGMVSQFNSPFGGMMGRKIPKSQVADPSSIQQDVVLEQPQMTTPQLPSYFSNSSNLQTAPMLPKYMMYQNIYN